MDNRRLVLIIVFIVSFSSTTKSANDYLDADYEDNWEASVGQLTASPSVPSRADVCVPLPLGGVEWLLSVRQSDYGWKEETHRAVIALAVNRWGSANSDEIRQMELQLEVELTRALLLNGTSELYPNDLALYVHALIATKRNPHNFYGIDLVSRLEKIVDSSHQSHPFLLLALCNADRFSRHHLHRAHTTLQKLRKSNNIEYLALALQAYECAGSRKHQVDDELIDAIKGDFVDRQHSDGSFGNVYTTSLVVQALASSTQWSNRQAALNYLKKRSTIDVNMVSTYLIQLALKAQNVHFIKDLHPGLELGPVVIRNREGDPFIQYTLRVGRSSDVYFTISIRVSPNVTFFEIMKLSAEQDSKFNFSYYLDKEEKPTIYSISGVPNDAEENLYWRLCLQTDINHNRHDYNMRTIHGSPIMLIPRRDEHVLYWYKDVDCETM